MNWIDTNQDGIEDEEEVYTYSQSYDAAGRIAIQQYPMRVHTDTITDTDTDTNTDIDTDTDTDTDSTHTPLRIQYHYHLYGQLQRIQDATEQKTYWQAEDYTAPGQLTSQTVGNGIKTDYHYDVLGRPTRIHSQSMTADEDHFDIQDEHYHYNALGQLIRRQWQAIDTGTVTTDPASGDTLHSEIYHYDAVNRLTQAEWTHGDSDTRTTAYYHYDRLGNLTEKQGRIYQYSGHRLTQVGAHPFSYDANGNLTADYYFDLDKTRSFSWTSYNKPRHITSGDTTLTFHYGANRSRMRQYNSNTATTITYINPVSEYHESPTERYYQYTLQIAGKAVLIQRHYSTEDPETTYLHHDHLGSIIAISDHTGTVVEQRNYDAFGKQRATPGLTALPSLTRSLYTCGYTGHEALDDVGLIHMNGRVYDATVGRFISADPFVQDPKKKM